MDEMRRDVRPLLLKVGVALALSLAGYLHLSLRPRRPPPSLSDGGLKDELSSLTTVEALPTVVEVSPSPAMSCKSSEEEESFLLPEFDQLLLKEFGQSEREMETIPTRDESESEKELAMEQEVAYLRNLVESLQERERTLEIQLFGCQGLREEESFVKELENRLKIMGTEAKLFALKTETLQAENQELRDQVLDHSRTAADLDIARQKIRLLERKLRLVGEQAKEDMATLQQQVALLQEREHRDRIKELEDEVIKLRKLNLDLAKKNSELQLKLEALQEAESMEEVDSLREQNDKLKADIDKLHTDRFSDVEELVYLRWINACLRYEMRSYQPPPGKAVARDLSKSLSPRSEQKAKQLILDYANSGIDERTTSVIDFDCDYSSSQASEEPDDISVDVSSTAKASSSRKAKFISKLKEVVLGKDHGSKKYSSFDIIPATEDTTGRISSCSSTSSISVDPSPGVGFHGNEQQRPNTTQE